MSLPRTALLLLFLWFAGPPATAAGQDAPPPLEETLQATGEAGVPVIAEELQAQVRGLPSQLRSLLGRKLEQGLIGGPEHLRRLLELRLSGEDLEVLLTDHCLLCHSDPDQQLEETLFVPGGSEGGGHLDLEEVVRGVHFRRGLSCAGCHGGSPADLAMTEEIYARWPDASVRTDDKSWIPDFCARCHSDPRIMRGFAPGLPTDQLEKYRTSRHGQLLLEAADSKAAQCVSCHGVHGIRSPTSPLSLVHPLNVASTCGRCHSDAAYMKGYQVDGRPLPTTQVADWTASVHGRRVLEEKDFGAPTCNDCHGNHAAMPPEVASVAQVCRTCHRAEANWFDASTHKQAFDRHGWPECVQCHGMHRIEPADESMLANRPGTLCRDCHAEFAPDNPSCNTTPDLFRTRLVALADGLDRLDRRSGELAEAGLDVEPLEVAGSRLEDALRNSRTRIHAFEPSLFAETADEGEAALAEGEGVIAGLEAEYRFRTGGLLVAIGVMALLALGLWLRQRAAERARGGAGGS